MNAVNQGRKREREWEATLNQGDSPSFPDTCHVCQKIPKSIKQPACLAKCFKHNWQPSFFAKKVTQPLLPS